MRGVREVLYGPDLPGCKEGNASTRQPIAEKQQHWGTAVDFSACVCDEDVMWRQCKGMETLAAVHARAADFLRWLFERPETRAVIVCHGQFIHALFGKRNVNKMFDVAEDDLRAVSLESVGNCQAHEVVLVSP